jgi:2-phospho-L-lactate guanylyltransferase (CobY/MobA/RfbA family)
MYYVLAHDEARRRAAQACMTAPDGHVVKIAQQTRNLEQNAAQWPILEAIADKLLWPVNGDMVKLTPEEFKDILTAAFKQEDVRLARGLNGGVVMLGGRTSKMSKQTFSEWLEFLHWFCAERGVDVGVAA